MRIGWGSADGTEGLVAGTGPGPGWEWNMGVESEDPMDERGQLHFLAALTDELMRALIDRKLMGRIEVQEIENRAADRVGTMPRAW